MKQICLEFLAIFKGFSFLFMGFPYFLRVSYKNDPFSDPHCVTAYRENLFRYWFPGVLVRFRKGI